MKRLQPKISERAFWDIDYQSIDWNKNIQYLLIKVFSRGTIEDIQEAIRFYGEKKVINELTEAESLPENVFFLALTIFNLKKSDFKCSITKL